MPVRLNPKSKRDGIYLDTGPWESAVLELKEAVKTKTEKLIKDEARLLVTDCIRLTPPTTGGSGVVKESLKKQEKAGKDAIYGDLKKVIYRYTELNLYKNRRIKDWLGKAYKAGNWMLMMDIINDKAGQAGNKVPDKFHENMRNKRGRVSSNNKRLYVKNEATIRQYAAKVFERIGKAKAGWLPAAKALKVAKRHRIAFISRHKGRGRVQIKGGNTFDTFVYVANLVDYIQKHGRERMIMAVAMKYRTSTIRKKITKIIEGEKKKKWNNRGVT